MGYPTDLTEEQWTAIEPRFKEKNGNYGNAGTWDKRILMNAVLYLTKTGCQWRMLPNDFPPYSTVSSFYHRAKKSGLWEVILRDLVKISRIQAGRKAEPTYAVVDSQSAKTTCEAESHGFDGGKKNQGQKAAHSDRYRRKLAESEST